MKVLRFTFLAIITLLYFSCTDNNLTGPLYSNLFPLRVGTYWEYESSRFYLNKQITSFDYMIDGKKGYKLRTSLIWKHLPSDTEAVGYSFLRIEDNELIEYYQPDCPQLYAILLRFPVELGTKWFKYHGQCVWGEVVYETTQTDSIYCYGKVFGPVSAQDSIMQIVSLTTAFRQFSECIAIEEKFPTVEPAIYWFQPGMGFVGMTHTLIPGLPPTSVGDTFLLKDFGSRREL